MGELSLFSPQAAGQSQKELLAKVPCDLKHNRFFLL
jgi:hypothetical protein